MTDAPDLQELVERYGTYSAIPPEAWEIFDDQQARYLAKLRHGELAYERWSQWSAEQKAKQK